MSRGGSYGGGQSSLGYLFGSDDQKQSPPPTAKPVIPPYGIDRFDSSIEFKPPDTPTNSSEKQKNSNNYHRAEGQNSGNFLTDRPTTKVKSAPGGDSSLGYLFGAK
ncbi:hypothetical protein EV1_038393 [Malus domestica]